MTHHVNIFKSLEGLVFNCVQCSFSGSNKQSLVDHVRYIFILLLKLFIFLILGWNIQAKNLYVLSAKRTSTAFPNWRNIRVLTPKSVPSSVSRVTSLSLAPIISRCTQGFIPERDHISVPSVRGLSSIVLH